MGEKYPQSTDVLIARLKRMAQFLEDLEEPTVDGPTMDEGSLRVASRAKWRAYTNLCWQVVGRLEELTAALEATAPRRPRGLTP